MHVVHVYGNVYVHELVHVHEHAYVYVYVYMYMHVYAYVCVCVCVFVCVRLLVLRFARFVCVLRVETVSEQYHEGKLTASVVLCVCVELCGIVFV